MNSFFFNYYWQREQRLHEQFRQDEPDNIRKERSRISQYKQAYRHLVQTQLQIGRTKIKKLKSLLISFIIEIIHALIQITSEERIC